MLSAAGTVAPSHPLLKLGKLTIKFELLCQFRKVERRCPFADVKLRRRDERARCAQLTCGIVRQNIRFENHKKFKKELK